MHPSGTIGWAIVGCGRVTDRRLAPVFARIDDATLVALCSRDLAKARSYAQRHRALRVYDSLDGLLADGGVDVVYIATPNALHVDGAIRCLAGGKHVLVDKPMATDAAAAQRMIEAAQKSGRLLGVMQQQRFHPANVHLIRLHDEGELGKLLFLRVHVGIWYPPAENWRGRPEMSGGGVVIDLGPHALDLMMQVAGDIRRVEAQTRNLQFAGPVEDFCGVRLEFAGGTLGLLELSYCSHEYGGRIEAYGSEATFLADGSMQQADTYGTWFRRGSEAGQMSREVGATDCYQAAIEDFTDAVIHRGDPAISMWDGLRVMQVIDAIYASARSGKPVDVAQPLTSDVKGQPPSAGGV